MPIQVEIIRTKRAGFPVDMKLTKTFWKQMARVRSAGIVDNIRKQKQGDGSPLKKNPPGYAKAKRKLGFGRRALIAQKKRLVKKRFQSYKILRFLGTGKDLKGVVIGPATAEIRRIMLKVQKRGYTGWLDRSKKMEMAMRAILRKEIRKQINKAIRAAQRKRFTQLAKS